MLHWCSVKSMNVVQPNMLHSRVCNATVECRFYSLQSTGKEAEALCISEQSLDKLLIHSLHISIIILKATHFKFMFTKSLYKDYWKRLITAQALRQWRESNGDALRFAP